GRFLAFPEQLHDLQLEISQTIHSGFAHTRRNDCGNTTMVVNNVKCACFSRTGSAGDSPAPVGDSSTGTSETRLRNGTCPLARRVLSHPLRRAAERHRRVACATQKRIFSNTAEPSVLAQPERRSSSSDSPTRTAGTRGHGWETARVYWLGPLSPI